MYIHSYILYDSCLWALLETSLSLLVSIILTRECREINDGVLKKAHKIANCKNVIGLVPEDILNDPEGIQRRQLGLNRNKGSRGFSLI